MHFKISIKIMSLTELVVIQREELKLTPKTVGVTPRQASVCLMDKQNVAASD